MTKKLILILVIVTGFAVTSCKNDKKEDSKTEEKADIATNEVYQCPMDCEDGKSYSEKGSCPVCKMDLKAKTVDMDSKDHKKHDENCTCKSGGECKCAGGECKCMTDDASQHNEDNDEREDHKDGGQN